MDLMHLVVSGGQRGEKGRQLLMATLTTGDADNACNIGNFDITIGIRIRIAYVRNYASVV
eukprot:8911667-Ditylum_brightwellii.AAC.1